jgi:hypothetical protein
MPSKPKKKSAEKASTKRVLILRTCDSQMLSHGGFIWPRTGRVEAPDWKSTKECGNGLHGFLHGLGDGSLASWDAEAVWIAAWVDESMVIDLDGKVKFPWAEVAVAGTREEAIQFLRDNGCSGAIVGGTATAGYRGTATAGYRGTATAGDGGTATAGDGGTATAGYRGTATAGDGGTATAGYGGTATAGYRGTATAGDGGTATAGYGGTATAGDGGTATAGRGGTATAGDGGTATAGYGGTATAGYGGTATAGDGGTATAGYGGTATAGDGGILNIRWWDRKNDRYRIATFYVGENNIQANTKYSVDDNGKEGTL